jgi:hypothetical protein
MGKATPFIFVYACMDVIFGQFLVYINLHSAFDFHVME